MTIPTPAHPHLQALFAQLLDDQRRQLVVWLEARSVALRHNLAEETRARQGLQQVWTQALSILFNIEPPDRQAHGHTHATVPTTSVLRQV